MVEPPFKCNYACQSRRSADGLRRARETCAMLLREYDNDRTLPVGHLRAAELHLAAVECWLTTGQADAVGADPYADTLVQRLEHAEGLAKELGLKELASTELQENFAELFFPPEQGERLIFAVGGSVKHVSFLHTGQIYLSSSRICFFSSVLGVDVQFGVPWDDVDKFHLPHSASTTAGHPIQMSLIKAATFDGQDLQMIELRVFDYATLGQLHRCAQHFLGKGLFDEIEVIQDANDAEPAARTVILGGTPSQSRPSMMSLAMDNPEIWDDPTGGRVAEDLRRLQVMWQCERRTTPWAEDWVPPFLPHDGNKKDVWVAIEDRYFKHPLLVGWRTQRELQECDRPPVNEIEFLGQMRPCIWDYVVEDGGTDENGWQYALDFRLDPRKWQTFVSTGCLARRRKWVAKFAKTCGKRREQIASSSPEETGGNRREETSSSSAGAPGVELELAPVKQNAQTGKRVSIREPDAEEGAQGAHRRTRLETMRYRTRASDAARLSSLISAKDLYTKWGAAKTILKVSLGDVSLRTLGHAFLSDDWATTGLMADNFRDMHAHDVLVGPWAEREGAAVKIRGKLRSMEAVVPIPPAPMCPKESRVTMVWHVLYTDDKLVLEQCAMSLDVPCGQAFNTVVKDTFECDEETGSTKMVRSYAVEWVQSTWMKKLVEANIPPNLVKDGERFAKLLSKLT